MSKRLTKIVLLFHLQKLVGMHTLKIYIEKELLCGYIEMSERRVEIQGHRCSNAWHMKKIDMSNLVAGHSQKFDGGGGYNLENLKNTLNFLR